MHVHENTCIFVSFLMYHQHPLFTKLAQNLAASTHTGFMVPLVAQGHTLPRILIAKQIQFDIWILDRLISDIKLDQSPCRIRFAVALLFDILNNKITEAIVNRVLTLSVYLLQNQNVAALMLFL
mgnify:CR=1 FL=1